MNQDRVTQIHVRGMRAIEELTLPLHGLTVLIGDNGSGKSTILDAVELLRQVTSPTSYVEEVLIKAHGDLRSLLRQGASALDLVATVAGDGPELTYALKIGVVGNRPQILHEFLLVKANPADPNAVVALGRQGSKATIRDLRNDAQSIVDVPDGWLAIASFGLAAQPVFQRMVSALSHIEHHAAFETRPLWQQRELELRVGPRWPELLIERRQHALARYALNLPSCYQQLRNRGGEVWSRVLTQAQLGLGNDLRELSLEISGRGAIELEAVFAGQRRVRADGLSEGQLSYLAFIALTELNQQRTLLVFDEPELHLHPALLTRVVGMLEQVARSCPVLLSTHSDRLLDALSDPAGTVLLCELNERGATELRRPNPEHLAEWLKTYRGLGSLRAEGYEANVFDGGPQVPAGEKKT